MPKDKGAEYREKFLGMLLTEIDCPECHKALVTDEATEIASPDAMSLHVHHRFHCMNCGKEYTKQEMNELGYVTREQREKLDLAKNVQYSEDIICWDSPDSPR